jgi:peroxiredoxin
MADGNDTQRNPTSAQEQTSRVLPAGTSAPDFTLKAAPDRTLSLSELRGKPVVIAFYPADWSPVCGDQMALYNEVLPDFQEEGAHLLGISVDSVWCHKAFSQARNLHFDLLADFEPKGAVSSAYGAYRNGDGFSERALFVVDANGIIQWSYLSPVGVNPGADGILNALASLTDEQRGKASGANASAGTRASGAASEATQASAAP